MEFKFIDSGFCYALMDEFLRDRIFDLVQKMNISTIVETGTASGGSTVLFAQMVPTVIGIEISSDYIDLTRKHATDLGVSNIQIIQGNSPDVLRQIMPKLPDDTIFFLDAHWGDYWPILDEVDAITPAKGVIIVHDMQVPGSAFKYDTYSTVDKPSGQPLNYEYLKDSLSKWSLTHRIEYNSVASARCPCGVGFIFPS